MNDKKVLLTSSIIVAKALKTALGAVQSDDEYADQCSYLDELQEREIIRFRKEQSKRSRGVSLTRFNECH